jgi:hypothetical protein
MPKRVKVTEKPIFSCESIENLGKIVKYKMTSLGFTKQEVL